MHIVHINSNIGWASLRAEFFWTYAEVGGGLSPLAFQRAEFFRNFEIYWLYLLYIGLPPDGKDLWIYTSILWIIESYYHIPISGIESSSEITLTNDIRNEKIYTFVVLVYLKMKIKKCSWECLLIFAKGWLYFFIIS